MTPGPPVRPGADFADLLTLAAAIGATPGATEREPSAAGAPAAVGGFSTVFDDAPVGMLLVGPDGRIVAANAAMGLMLGRRPEQLIAESFADITAPEDVAAEWDLFAEITTSPRVSVVREKRYRHADGHLVTAVSSSTPIRDEAGRLTSVLSLVESIEDRRRAEETLVETQSATDAIVTVDAGGRVVAWNRGAERIFGYSRPEALGRPVAGLVVPERNRARFAESLAGDLDRLTGTVVELTARRADGSELPVEMSVSRWQRGGHELATAIVRDVTERRRLQRELLERAGTDPLTRAANRSRLTSTLASLLSDPGSVPIGVVVADLDGFGTVNRGFGPDVGDELLVEVARRVRSTLRPGELLGRLGSDELAVVLPSTTVAGAERVARGIGDLLRTPFALRSATVGVGASFGVAARSRPVRASGAAERAAAALLRDAAVALGDARCDHATGRVRRYRPASRGAARRRLLLHQGLRDALLADGSQANGIHLAYQPQVDLATGATGGLEALARWEHPTLGPVSPIEFVALAEDTGLAPALGAWVLRRACAQLASFGPRGVRVSVNVSARQLGDDAILDDVAGALAGAGLEPATLTVEVTESVMMSDPEGASRRLGALRELGVRVSIDDFGTGYSNLASLGSSPVDELKIDRSFVTRLPGDRVAARVTTTVVELGRALGLEVVAEGIESAAQERFLRCAGCHTGQGYRFARPLPPTAVPAWLERPPRRQGQGR